MPGIKKKHFNQKEEVMKKLSMIFGVAAMVLFTACTKVDPANSVRKVVLNASMEATKTSINETTGAVTWKTTDQIKVVDEEGNTLILPAVEVNGKSAKFEKELEEGEVFGTIKYAFYPASKFTVSDGNITVTPMGSSPSPYNSLDDQIPSFANVNGGSAVFTNLFGILRMDLVAGEIDGLGANLNFKVSSTKNVFGSYSLVITGDSYALNPSACEQDCSWGGYGFSGDTYYFIVPEGAFDGGLTFTAKSGPSASVTSSNVVIEKSKLVQLPPLTINSLYDEWRLWITK